MNFALKPDHTRASITLYYIVALNTKHKLKNTLNRKDASQVLANLLQIDRRASMSWLRGDFKKHPISREKFMKFIRAYRTKPGLATAKAIAALALDLYGPDYQKALELLDPADRDNHLAQEILVRLPGASDVVATINDLLEFGSPEAIESAFLTMKAYQWSAGKSRRGDCLT